MMEKISQLSTYGVKFLKKLDKRKKNKVLKEGMTNASTQTHLQLMSTPQLTNSAIF